MEMVSNKIVNNITTGTSYGMAFKTKIKTNWPYKSLTKGAYYMPYYVSICNRNTLCMVVNMNG